jgi:hypothetical protein
VRPVEKALALLKNEALKVGLDIREKKTKYMKVMRN